MTGRFRAMPVAYVRPETDAAIVVGFRPQDRAAFAFRPGQYLTLKAEIDGAVEQRCYSICSTPADDAIEVAIKRVPGGRFSEWAHGALVAGASLDVMAPEGRFGQAADPARSADYLAVAAGSGVTPILALARTLLAAEPSSRFTFVYGNRTTTSIMFREALDDLKDRYLDRFSLIHVLSRERHDAALAEGRIDADCLKRLADHGFIEPDRADAIFLCGPGDLLDTATATLLDLGAPANAIQTERFLPAPGAPTGRRAPATAAARHAIATVTAIVDGATLTFEMSADDPSAILAAERQGVDLPSSCRGGMCCTCRARIVDGAAEMAVNYSLEDWELAAGFVLACQVRPTTERLTLDFDAV